MKQQQNESFFMNHFLNESVEWMIQRDTYNMDICEVKNNHRFTCIATESKQHACKCVGKT